METDVHDLLDLERYPLISPDPPVEALVARCAFRARAWRDVQPEGVGPKPLVQSPRSSPGGHVELIHMLARTTSLPDASKASTTPSALKKFQTINHTLCDDQLTNTFIHRLYEWQPLVDFIAQVLNLPRCISWTIRSARVNVMEYRPGEALNWHFDRAVQQTTLVDFKRRKRAVSFSYCTEAARRRPAQLR